MSLYLIDGTANIYRAFFAIRNLSNSRGFPTNAIYGFVNMLFKLIKDRDAAAIAVAFDSAQPTQRHRLYPAYKAQRPHPPDELIAQLAPIRDILQALDVKTFAIPGVEADDILATVAKRVASEGADVYIVSSDKDLLQVLEPRIRIYDPVKDVELDVQHVIRRFGLPPGRVTEVMALTGDASDNIPGVKGVGEKTAVELLRQFSSLDELINNPSKIANKRIRNLVLENVDNIRLSKQLVTIDTDLPMEVDVDDLFAERKPNRIRLMALFTEYGFASFMRFIPPAEALTESKTDIEIVTGTEGMGSLEVSTLQLVSLRVATDSANNPAAIALAVDGKTGYYAEYTDDNMQLRDVLNPLLSDVPKVGHDIKGVLHVLARIGIKTVGYLYDTMIASYLLNPNREAHRFVDILTEYLAYDHGTGLNPVRTLAEEAVVNLRLREVLFERLGEAGLLGLYDEIEMPLVYVLRDMEANGIKLDTTLISDLSTQVGQQMASIERRIYMLAGEEFNINSPKQLSEVLFTRLKLPTQRKTKTGYSTDNAVLEALALRHELPAEIIEFRALAKLKHTYLDTLATYVNPATGRLHTTFNQTTTATGRLSSSEPNLQNIPVSGHWGQQLRGAFVAEAGNCLLSADYSQIELRVLAHLSGDVSLVEAFVAGEDVHDRTAREVFNVQGGAVTADMRRIAKTINFGIIYGMSPHGLSDALKISHEDSRRYIDAFFQRHDGVRSYIDRVIEGTRRRGFAETLKGRRRPIFDLNSSNHNRRTQAERLAINTLVQGSAADIIKVAMVNVYSALVASGLSARMLLQVHDELLFEVPEAEVDTTKALVVQQMEAVVALSVPLKVDVGVGPNWAEAHR
ncbi:MAG: DNA polymerase I [Nitrospirae bacterium]|uniref:DNA polymerase I n=1 Tax=Candidatus Magnetobacterium casense TaxID=1455061 RepID=UPI00058C1287|nr:DNA polymerase I [Candidatus Magnetobacterium casensis]MBF0338259.1 DNA polymerase I [Nitrospirota bacterium]